MIRQRIESSEGAQGSVSQQRHGLTKDCYANPCAAAVWCPGKAHHYACIGLLFGILGEYSHG